MCRYFRAERSGYALQQMFTTRPVKDPAAADPQLFPPPSDEDLSSFRIGANGAELVQRGDFGGAARAFETVIRLEPALFQVRAGSNALQRP